MNVQLRGALEVQMTPSELPGHVALRALVELPCPPSVGTTTLQLTLALRVEDPDAYCTSWQGGGDTLGDVMGDSVCYLPISEEHSLHVACR